MEEGKKEVFTMIEPWGKDGENGKSRWVKIGVGFVNKDNSINLYLDALPINGKLNVRDPFKKQNIEEVP